MESVALLSATGAGPSYSLVALQGQVSADKARIVAPASKLSRLIGVALFWLIPAMSLSIVAAGSKSLIDADVFWKLAATTTVTEAENVPPTTPTTARGRTALQITPVQDEARLRLEQVVTDAPAEPTSTTTAQVQSSGGANVVKDAQTRPAPLTLPPVTAGRGPIQRRPTRIERPFFKNWELPGRLTDGF